jgi:peptidoglycan/LPS O-acetylase OafA/YrhL
LTNSVLVKVKTMPVGASPATSGTRPNGLGLRESLYLDFVRSFAAFMVVLDHAPTVFDLPGLPRWGHQAVMVFFVLSGYVISNVADTRERTARTFIVARLARVWSVVFPAMALTVLCDVLGRHLSHDPGLYLDRPFDLPFIRVGAMLVFLSETWVSIQPLSNGVVWSLCAEFWYYMLFAAWVFVPPGRQRAAAVAAAALLAGHKALLLLPIWLMGVALQRSRSIRRFSTLTNVLLWSGGLICIGWVVATRAYDPVIGAMSRSVSPWIFVHLAQARVFWFDWLFGLAVMAHLLGARTIAAWLPLERIAGPIRWCAGISFAAYLFHMPVLTFCAAVLPRNQGWLGIALTLAVIAILGPPVERSKSWWRRMLNRAADALPWPGSPKPAALTG